MLYIVIAFQFRFKYMSQDNKYLKIGKNSVYEKSTSFCKVTTFP